MLVFGGVHVRIAFLILIWRAGCFLQHFWVSTGDHRASAERRQSFGQDFEVSLDDVVANGLYALQFFVYENL